MILQYDMVSEQQYLNNILAVINGLDGIGRFDIVTKQGYENEWENNQANIRFDRKILYSIIYYNSLPVVIAMTDLDVGEMDDQSYATIKGLLFTQLTSYLAKNGIYALVEKSRHSTPPILTVHYHKKYD